MARKPAQPTANLREQALASIRRGILDSRYPPGSLLSESQLAEELRISRTPIREALRELAGSGLVRILPQRGVVVSELSVQDIVEVYQLREQLECFAARLAAERLAPPDGAAFEADHAEALRHMEAGRPRHAYDASVRLHGRVVELARNSRLTQFMGQLGDQVHRFGLLTLRHGRVERALHEHGEIIQALLRRDGDAADALMRAHLRADRDLALRITLPAGFSSPELSG
jgi:DNA-binding GntR family transcriptional regulator